MTEQAWWQTAVVYQIYPRSFQDSNGDGIGDLAGIVDRLDYLSDVLGVDALWLSPFQRSPMADFGYDVADYCDVDPIFGDLGDFDRLVAAAHARSLKVIIDLVPNHTSNEHAWFVESASSRTNPKRDWYVWRDPKPDGSPPNNWLSAFGGPAWTLHEATGQYYLHSFLAQQPDLNWRNPEVAEAMWDVVRFWLDRGVDGYRIDVAHHIMKDPHLRDNPPAPNLPGAGFKNLGAYAGQLHVHDKGHPDVHDMFRRLRALVGEYEPERVLIGEIHEFEFAELVSYYGRDLDELHLPFNFSLLYTPWTAEAIEQRVAGYESALIEGAWPNHVLGNHDEPRLATRFGRNAARQAAVLLLTLRGTPTLYYGDEIGMADAAIPPDRQQDPWAIREPELGRDGCRTPMQWDSGPNAGFAPELAEPWLPVSGDRDRVNVADQLEDPASLLNLYRRLLELRRARPSLAGGSLELLAAPSGCLAYRRKAPGDRPVLVALNLGSGPARIDDAEGDILAGTDPNRSGPTSGGLTLAPGEAVVIEASGSPEAPH